GSDRETGRLLAKADVARVQLAHLIRTEAPENQIRSVANIAYELAALVDRTIVTRKENGKELLPAPVYTTLECQELMEYHSTRSWATKDEHAAARIQAVQALAGAELTDLQGKADAFQTTRHLWKFEIEGWQGKLSLKDVELEIRAKTDEKLKLVNFLRP